jgi:hypothetical protein
MPLRDCLSWGGILLSSAAVISHIFELALPIGAVGFGFFLAGLGLLLPLWLALFTWDEATAQVVDVDNSSEDQTICFAYQINGSIHTGKHTETGLRRVGDTLNLRVHPTDRQVYLTYTGAQWIIGAAFIVLGPLIATNLPL